MNWDWEWTREFSVELFTTGLKVTAQITVFGAIVAFIFGLLLALLRRSKILWVSTAARWFIQFVRSTPLLVQLFFLFYVLPTIPPNIKLSALTAGILGLGVHYACYTAEVYRAGIDGVPPGQFEAATALNLPQVRTWTSVILPQALRRSLPALGNVLVAIFKESPQLSIITVLDVIGTAQELGSERFRYLEPLTVAGLFFLVLAIPASIMIRRLERRLEY
ncbi:MAG TPA: ectoine/hydroxyectoine ABC transporter permease subunit EhuD [Streptosporangiaceae bacterium]|nr:ectoine/hydroxyectoine ABC transporter permease subunit EhuD [Streptosporangiaceae bacterium]